MEEDPFVEAGTVEDPLIKPEPHSNWQDAMEVFKRAYPYVKREYCISKDQEQQLDEIFESLCKKLEGKPKTVEYSVLGSTDFAYLPYMLNLKDEAICALLPYLLDCVYV